MSESLAQLAVGALGTVAVLLAKAVWERARHKHGHHPMEQRMKALEERQHKQTVMLQGQAGRLAVAENDIGHVKGAIQDIKDTLIRMDDKLDRALDR